MHFDVGNVGTALVSTKVKMIRAQVKMQAVGANANSVKCRCLGTTLRLNKMETAKRLKKNVYKHGVGIVPSFLVFRSCAVPCLKCTS